VSQRIQKHHERSDQQVCKGALTIFPDVNNVLRSSSGLSPRAVYDGGYPEAKEIKLKIANGGAGQSGLIGAWADAFIQYCVKQLGYKPFKVCFKSIISVSDPDHFNQGWLVPRRYYREFGLPAERLGGRCGYVQRGG